MHSQPEGSGKSAKDYGAKDKGKLALRDIGVPQEPPSKIAQFSDLGQVNPGNSAGKSSGSGSNHDRDELMKILWAPGDKLSVTMQALKVFPIESRTFWREYCRNCFIAGKGFAKHTLYECQQLGNACYIRCQKCKEGNHWATDCPVFRSAP